MTLSTDKAAEIRAGRGVHGLQATMLADPQSEVAGLYGLINQRFNNFFIPGRSRLPVPTTLLIDPSGKVVWMDQSENYTQRSDPAIVGQMLATHLS